MHTPNNTVSEYLKQNLIELKEELHKSTITIENF